MCSKKLVYLFFFSFFIEYGDGWKKTVYKWLVIFVPSSRLVSASLYFHIATIFLTNSQARSPLILQTFILLVQDCDCDEYRIDLSLRHFPPNFLYILPFPCKRILWDISRISLSLLIRWLILGPWTWWLLTYQRLGRFPLSLFWVKINQLLNEDEM